MKIFLKTTKEDKNFKYHSFVNILNIKINFCVSNIIIYLTFLIFSFLALFVLILIHH